MKDFFNRLNEIGKPKRRDIIEKDFHIHVLLDRISREENFVFKGGTCLMKGYLGYYRFSEDIDLAWKDVTLWQNKSRSKVARECSKQIDHLIHNISGMDQVIIPVAAFTGLRRS